MISSMVKVLRSLQMVPSLKDSMSMANLKVSGDIRGRTVNFTKVNG